MTIESLVAGATDGDVDAFTELVVRYQGMSFAYAYSVLGDYQLAEDATQQAFITAWRNLGSLRDSSRFGGWLRGIVRFESLRVLRDRSRNQEASLAAMGGLEPADLATDVETQVGAREELGNLMRCMEQLPDRHRVVTQLYYLADQPQSAVANFLGISVSAVNNRLREARAILRKEGVFPVNPDSFTTPDMSEPVGKVIRSERRLIDIQIASDKRPPILTSVAIDHHESAINAFVAQYIDDDVARLIVDDALNHPLHVDAAVRSSNAATSSVMTAEAIDQLLSGPLSNVDKSPIQTGIKVIDMFASLVNNGIAAVVGETNVGKLVVAEEICTRLQSTDQNLTLLVFLASPNEVEMAHKLDVQFKGQTTVIMVPVLDASPTALASTLVNVDSVMVMSGNLAKQGCYPAIDPIESHSSAERSCELPSRARALLQEPGERASLLRAYLTQPFLVAEDFTGLPGSSVNSEDSIRDVQRILQGSIEGLEPESLMMSGALPPSHTWHS